MAVSWTEEQQRVIDARGCNILVSAAAGSGKTAVLVERIVKRITDPKAPVDIDRLLVVTFTRAAAGEMKERIRAAIEKKLEEDQESEHLQRQSALVHHAQITTIDSFCSYVVKNYFHMIDLDPSFRMGDEGEMKLLAADVAGEILEEAYQEGRPEFSAFVDGFSGGKTDKKIEELILKLYEFSTSYPYPEEWLEECKRAYEIQGPEDLEKAPWLAVVTREVRKEIREAAQLLDQAVQTCEDPEGPGFYLPLLQEEKRAVEKAEAAEDFFGIGEVLRALEFKRLPPGKKAEKERVSPQSQELAKNLRSQAKDMIKALGKKYFTETREEAAEHMRRAGEPVRVLAGLAQAFTARYKEKKQEKNILDFSDLEHYALEILVRHTAEGDFRTEAAKELSGKFAEIMIDEYQDSNLVQEKLLTAVSKMEEGVNNIFMVGDVKQSIYRFRLARPDLFMEKFRTYPLEEGGKNLRIDLHKNFRSRAQVLESVNYLFYQLMGEDLGGVEYNEDAALYPEGKFPLKEKEEDNPATELLLLEEDDPVLEEQKRGENSRELEARMAALRIRELMDTIEILDKGTQTYRPARFSDFTILLRTMSGWAETFKRILNACQIPASVTTKTGYFSASEVAAALDYLQILDNPMQDIPLSGAMRNMPEGFSFEELAKIKQMGKKKEKTSLFEAVLLAEEREDGLGDKVRGFLRTYRRLREKVPYTPIHELLWDFFDETGFLLYQQAFTAGEQKKANLLMLLEKARDYESTSYKGLFNFVRYIENLKKYQVDFGEANILSEQEDTVRIMSIHGSKGLEFPVVFVAGMGKQINLQDTREGIVLHPDLGIGAPCIDEETRIRTKTLLQKAVQQELTLESLGEELRILYVALTRAKEKLILTGTVSKLQEKLGGCEALKRQTKRRLSYGTRQKGRSYLDWTISALARHKSMKNLYEACGLGVYPLNPLYEGGADFFIRRLSPMELLIEESRQKTQEAQKEQDFLSWDFERIYDRKAREELEESFSYEYPYKEQALIPVKLTVSELKRLQGFEEEESRLLYEPQEEEEYVPVFMREEEEELKGAGRGTAYHRVLECLDYGRTKDRGEIAGQLQEMLDRGRLTEPMRRAVRAGDIYQFIQSGIGQRIKAAAAQGRLYREQPFVLGLPAEQVREEFHSQEPVLIQGIIDVYFEEPDGLVLVDYKTDRVSPEKPEELIEKYRIQLEYYAQALHRLTGKPVKEKYIYSLGLGRELSL